MRAHTLIGFGEVATWITDDLEKLGWLWLVDVCEDVRRLTQC